MSEKNELTDYEIQDIVEDVFTDALGTVYNELTPSGQEPDFDRLKPIVRKALEQVIRIYLAPDTK